MLGWIETDIDGLKRLIEARKKRAKELEKKVKDSQQSAESNSEVKTND